MAQAQMNTKRRVVDGATSQETYPVEVIQLLDVLARIEARRQAKLRALRKDGE